MFPYFRRYLPALPILSFCLALLTAVQAGAEALSAPDAGHVDALLLIDSSGSMLMTDPARLRDEGAKLFIKSLREGDRLGVIEFSAKAKVVQPLSEYNSNLETEVSQKISAIANTGTHTDLMSGIKLAREIFESDIKKGNSQVIILLSDGKMEPDPSIASPKERNDELFNSYLPDLKADGVAVHTLAFSDKADKEALAQIAAASDGMSMFTPNADMIHQSFTDLFLAIKKPQVLPISGRGFKIDEDVSEATFYINREGAGEITIVKPSGSRLKDGVSEGPVKWFKGKKFDIVTIATPEAGEWQVLGIKAMDGFATLLTNLKLVTSWPSSINAEEPTLLQARLYEDEKPVVLEEISGGLEYAFQIVPTDKISEPILRAFLKDDGKNGDKIADDGIFSSNVQIDEAGEYKLKVVAHSPTFDRYQHLPFRVKHPLIKLSVRKGGGEHAAHDQEGGHGEHADEGGHKSEEHGEDEEKVHEEDNASEQADVFVAALSSEAQDLKKPEVKLVLVDRERHRFIVEMLHGHEPGTFELSSDVLPSPGAYEVQAELSGTSRSKKNVKASSKKLSYVYSPAGAAEAHVIEVKEPGETKLEIKKDDKKKETEEAPGALLYIILATVWNLIAAGASFVLFRKAGSGPSIEMPQFQPAEVNQKAIENLRTRITVSEIDLNDPLFTGVEPESDSGGEPEPAAQEPSAGDSEANQSSDPGEQADLLSPSQEAEPQTEAAEGQAEGEAEGEATPAEAQEGEEQTKEG